MVTGDLRNKIDGIWNAFWSGGIANPIEVIEQLTYLLFVRRLDDLHTLAENKATTAKRPIENPIYPDGADDRGRAYDDLRWSRFKHMAAEMFTVVSEHVSPLGNVDCPARSGSGRSRRTVTRVVAPVARRCRRLLRPRR